MRSTALISFLVLAVIILAHGAGIENGWLNFDDPIMVRDNPALDHPGASELLTMATEVRNHAYLPLYTLAYVPDVLLGGKAPRALHLGSILWHLLNSALVFVVFSRLTGKRELAGLAALIFAAHPVGVESVAWIAGRKDQVSLALLLLGLLPALRYLRQGGWQALAFSGLLSVLACFAKGSALVFPGLALVMGWRLLAQGEEVPKRRLFVSVAVLSLLALLPLTVHLMVAKSEGAAGAGALHSASAGVPLFLEALGRYAAHLLVPAGLSIHYDLSPNSGALFPQVQGAVVLALLVALTVLLSRRRGGVMAFSAAWILISLLPFNNVFPRTAVAMADRYLAIGLPAFGLLVAALVVKIQKPAVRYVIGAAVVLALVVLARERTAQFQSGESVFRAALGAEPTDSLAPLMIGDALLERAEDAADRPALIKEAIALFGRAVTNARHPVTEVRARLRLGDTLLRTGEYEAALAEFDRIQGLMERDPERFLALGLKPNTVALNRANAAKGLGRVQDARRILQGVRGDDEDDPWAKLGLLDLDLASAAGALQKAQNPAIASTAKAKVDEAIDGLLALVSQVQSRRDRASEEDRPALTELLRTLRVKVGDVLMQASWRKDRLLGGLSQAEALIEENPKRAEGYLLRAAVRGNLVGEERGALNDLIHARELSPGNSAVAIALATRYREAGERKKAVLILDDLIGRGGDVKAATVLRGDIYLADAHAHRARQRPQKALIAVAEALRLDPTNVEASLLEGELLESLGKWDAAKAAFERTLAADAQNERAKLGLGRYYQACGLRVLSELGRARDVISKQMEGRPEAEIEAAIEQNEDALRELAVAHYGNALALGGDSDQVAIAREYVGQMRDRQRRLAARQLGDEARALLALGEREEARKKFEQAVLQDDTSVDSVFSLGVLESSAQDFEPAITHFERVLTLDRSHLGALFHVARAYHVVGRADDAKTAITRFLRLAEAHPAKSALLGEIKEAERLLALIEG